MGTCGALFWTAGGDPEKEENKISVQVKQSQHPGVEKEQGKTPTHSLPPRHSAAQLNFSVEYRKWTPRQVMESNIWNKERQLIHELWSKNHWEKSTWADIKPPACLRQTQVYSCQNHQQLFCWEAWKITLPWVDYPWVGTGIPHGRNISKLHAEIKSGLPYLEMSPSHAGGTPAVSSLKSKGHRLGTALSILGGLVWLYLFEDHLFS